MVSCKGVSYKRINYDLGIVSYKRINYDLGIVSYKRINYDIGTLHATQSWLIRMLASLVARCCSHMGLTDGTGLKVTQVSRCLILFHWSGPPWIHNGFLFLCLSMFIHLP